MWPNPLDPTEPQWSRADVDKAVLWQVHEQDRCQLCGTFPDDWPQDDRDFPPFIGEPYRCKGCAELDMVRDEEVPKEGDDARGVYVRLIPFDPDLIDKYEADADERRKRALRVDESKLDEPGPLAGPTS